VLSGCSGKGELVVDEGVGITAVRDVPGGGHCRLHRRYHHLRVPGSSDRADIDLTAAITEVRPPATRRPAR
jgi:hypothetical protein